MLHLGDRSSLGTVSLRDGQHIAGSNIPADWALSCHGPRPTCPGRCGIPAAGRTRTERAETEVELVASNTPCAASALGRLAPVHWRDGVRRSSGSSLIHSLTCRAVSSGLLALTVRLGG